MGKDSEDIPKKTQEHLNRLVTFVGNFDSKRETEYIIDKLMTLTSEFAIDWINENVQVEITGPGEYKLEWSQ